MREANERDKWWKFTLCIHGTFKQLKFENTNPKVNKKISKLSKYKHFTISKITALFKELQINTRNTQLHE